MKLSDIMGGAQQQQQQPPPGAQPQADAGPPQLRMSTGLEEDDPTKQTSPLAARASAAPLGQPTPSTPTEQPRTGLHLSDIMGRNVNDPAGLGPPKPKPKADPNAVEDTNKKDVFGNEIRTKDVDGLFGKHKEMLAPGSQLTFDEQALSEQQAFVRGVPGGSYMDEAHAAFRGVLSWTTGGSFTGEYKHDMAEQKRRMDIYDAEHPVASTVRTLAGVAATLPFTPEIKALQGLGLAGRSAVGALFGGIGGAVQGFGEGDTFDERKKNALLGGAFGLVAGTIFPPILAIAESPIGKAAVGTVGGAAIGAYEDPNNRVEGMGAGAVAGGSIALGINRYSGPAKDFAVRYLGKALKEDEVTKEQAQAFLKKPNTSLSGLGSESVKSAGEQAALTRKGRTLANTLYVDNYAKGREAESLEAVNHLVADQGFFETIDSLQTGQSDMSGPLYDIAFKEADSKAPFLHQHTEAWDVASSKARAADDAIATAEHELTQATAKQQRAGNNVYGNSSANQEIKAATAKLEQAHAAQQAATAERETALTNLRASQSDVETGARGGFTSPYLQRVMAQPEGKIGLNLGIKELRQEAVAKRKPFNPSEYAIVGEDAEGNPIVGPVPNLRLYDAVKRGLDQQLEQFRDKVTGKIPKNKQTIWLMQIRREFVKELDSLAPPEYALARKAWEGPARMRDAMYKGKNWAKVPHEVITRYKKGLTPAERDTYKIGVARDLSLDISDRTRGPLKTAQDLVGSSYHQKRLLAALDGDKEAFDKLMEMANNQIKQDAEQTFFLKGSQTARRIEGGKEFSNIGPVVDDFVSSARHSFSGIAAAPKQQVGRTTSKWIEMQVEMLTRERREELADMMFGTDQEKNMQILDMLYDEARNNPKFPGIILKPALAGGRVGSGVNASMFAPGGVFLKEEDEQEAAQGGMAPPPELTEIDKSGAEQFGAQPQ